MSIDQQNHFDIASVLFDHLPDDKFAKPQMKTKVAPDIDLATAMEQALAAPVYYPSLKDSVFPGDSVAIILQSDLAQPKHVLESLLQQLSTASVALADIVVVVTPAMADQFGIDASLYENPDESKLEGKRPPVLPIEFGFNTIKFQVHDSENQSGLSYLVANEEGEPLHVNRLLVDADVLLPVGSPTPGDASQQTDCLYPDFSSLEVKDRFAKRKGSFISRWQEIELANDTIGSFFTIQIVCGPGDSIRNIIAGARKDAVTQARELTNQLWTLDWQGSAEVTVATIESTSHEQTWDDFSHALVAAADVSKTDGPIIIWSEIKLPPDRNIRKALMSQFEENISSKLTKTLQHVAAIVNERPVFLRSGLNRSAVEELGLGFVETPQEIIRISEPHTTGLLIRDAHKCQISSNPIPDDLESQ